MASIIILVKLLMGNQKVSYLYYRLGLNQTNIDSLVASRIQELIRVLMEGSNKTNLGSKYLI